MRLSEDGSIPVVGVNYKDQSELAKSWLETNGNPFAFSIEDANGRFGIDLGVYGAPRPIWLMLKVSSDTGTSVYWMRPSGLRVSTRDC